MIRRQTCICVAKVVTKGINLLRGKKTAEEVPGLRKTCAFMYGRLLEPQTDMNRKEPLHIILKRIWQEY
jgi:hypothetical protein